MPIMRLVVLALTLPATLTAQATTRIPIETGKGLEPMNVVLAPVTYHGRPAVRVGQVPPDQQGRGEAVAIVTGLRFEEGTIEVDVAGAPGPDAVADDRGFVGMAFHITPTADRMKTFYLRPTNGRADEQLRRNHSIQFTADPDWPWYRLRKELPGQYESYVDLVPGEWTSIRIEIHGTRADFYVNGASQPALVVTDMKDSTRAGGIALWIGRGTLAYFSNLRVTPAPH